MDKPRTWWIVNWGGMNQDHELRATKRPLGPEYFVEQYEVIEKSAYDRYKRALEACKRQRDEWIDSYSAKPFDAIAKYNAELEALLEGKNEI